MEEKGEEEKKKTSLLNEHQNENNKKNSCYFYFIFKKTQIFNTLEKSAAETLAKSPLFLIIAVIIDKISYSPAAGVFFS